MKESLHITTLLPVSARRLLPDRAAGWVALLAATAWLAQPSPAHAQNSFTAQWATGISSGALDVELFHLKWGICAVAGTIAALVAITIRGILGVALDSFDGTYDTAGRPNRVSDRSSNRRAYGKAKNSTVVVVFVIFLSALVTVAGLGVKGAFASVSIDYSSPRLLFWKDVVLCVPLFSFYFGAVFSIPGASRKLALDIPSGEKAVFGVWLAVVYALLLLGAGAAWIFVRMYSQRLHELGG